MHPHDTPTPSLYTQLKHGTLIVEDIDADLLMLRWTANRPGGTKGTLCRTFYAHRVVTKNGKKCHLSMHRVIMSRIVGRDLDRSEHVDHINGDGLDNRRSNLRLCSAKGNTKNRTRISISNKSGVTGVHWNRHAGKWIASICITQANGTSRQKHLGCFTSVEDAARVRREAELVHYGEFAPKK